jgi:hypothetical protein
VPIRSILHKVAGTRGLSATWKVIRFPAIAEEDEIHVIQSSSGTRTRRFERRAGDALHPERELLEVLNRLREALGGHNYCAVSAGPGSSRWGLVKAERFKTYADVGRPAKFETIFQSWDTANKPTELSDCSVCTT